MEWVTNLNGHTSDRKGCIKHPKIYGTEEETFTYFDDTGTDSRRNIVLEGRLCRKGKEIMGRQIKKDFPFVYMPINYWNSLSTEEKTSQARGYFERMVTFGRKVPPDARFIVRVAEMHVQSSWCNEYLGYEQNEICYGDYQNKSDYELVEFLDGLLIQRC